MKQNSVPSYKLTIAYDGTDFHGWQWQDNLTTVDRVLYETFLGVFKQESAYFVGASRTDAGVHAQGQVARLRSSLNLPPERMLTIWNDALPAAIVIQTLELVNDSFHPQHNIDHKTYIYRIFTERPNPYQARYGWFISRTLNKDILEQTLQLFVGTHNFRAFCKEEPGKDTIRTISAITVFFCPVFNAYTIRITGNSFLRHMIRRIVGASVENALSRKDLTSVIYEALHTQKNTVSLLNAPANGLCLEKITYTEHFLVKEPIHDEPFL